MYKVKLTKISDDAFNGVHPNGIDTDYTKIGTVLELPKLGERFHLSYTWSTSTVIQELNEEDIFKTRNSTYKLEILE